MAERHLYFGIENLGLDASWAESRREVVAYLRSNAAEWEEDVL